MYLFHEEFDLGSFANLRNSFSFSFKYLYTCEICTQTHEENTSVLTRVEHYLLKLFSFKHQNVLKLILIINYDKRKKKLKRFAHLISFLVYYQTHFIIYLSLCLDVCVCVCVYIENELKCK